MKLTGVLITRGSNRLNLHQLRGSGLTPVVWGRYCS